MDQNKFGFQPNINHLESYMKENESSNSQYDGPTWWSLPSGMSSVRILPPWDATGRVALAVYSHPIEFQGKDMRYKKYSWTCVNKTFGKPCNICQGLESIKESGVDVSNYEPNRRTFYFNAIVMLDPDYDRDIKSGKRPEDCNGVAPGTHVLMRAPKTVYDWVVSNITNPLVGDITSVTNGIDLLITKEGSGLDTKYTTTLSPNGRQPVPQEYLDKIESLYNLDDVFSTGFEKEQIDELVNTLRRSSGALQSGIPYMAQQMSGGYQSTPNTGAIPPMPHEYNPQMPAQMTPPQMMPSAPPAFNQQTYSPPIPNPQVEQFNQAPPATSNVSTPECFSKGYSASDVKCVTCPFEIDCSKSVSR